MTDAAMAWGRALVAYVSWVLVHAAGGAIFAVAVVYAIPQNQWSPLAFTVDGLVAGVIFGLGQWLVLEWMFGRMYWWLLATVPASPASWLVGYVIAFATLGLGGWIGALVPAAAQTLVLSVSFKRGPRGSTLPLALAWFPAAMLGAIAFYSNFVAVLNRRGGSPVELIAIGCIVFGALTGLVIAGLAATVARSSAGSRPRRA